jgi:aspartyl-tRNA(Asn)/glutamyl-tRNA(Gln) amidotransferase subunit A
LTELADCTVSELLTAYRTKEASPREALESCLGRIQRLDSAVGAVLTLIVEGSVRQADEATGRWYRGDARALEGVPYGLKDIIAAAGIRNTGGSTLYAEYLPKESATLAKRLAAAGGVLVAKLQTFEFASGSNATTSNPWDLERWPCGSSSGSAAAVAAHELPLAIGTDTGGSVIGPAAFCGIVGQKPTFGRIPRTGIMPLSWTLDHAGILARSAFDAALSLGVVAGHDSGDPTSARAPVSDYTAGIGDGVGSLRIGVPSDWFFDVCDPEVEASVRAAIQLLADHGASVTTVELPSTHIVDLHAIELTIVHAERAALHEITFPRVDAYGPEFRRLLLRSQFTSAADYLKALRARHLVQLDFQAAFERVDVLIVPAQVCTAPKQDHLVARIGADERPLMDVASRPTAIMNAVGIPTLCVPTGFDALQLPMGMQIAARPYDEATCLRVGHAYQQLTDYHRALPPVVTGDLGEARSGRPSETLPSVVCNPVSTATKDSLAR